MARDGDPYAASRAAEIQAEVIVLREYLQTLRERLDQVDLDKTLIKMQVELDQEDDRGAG